MKIVHSILSICGNVAEIFSRINNRLIAEYTKSRLGKCGENVYIDRDCILNSTQNISISSNVFIGAKCIFQSTHGKIVIDEHVMFGPGVHIHGGDHIFCYAGQWMDGTKKSEGMVDGVVHIEKDCWIGANAMLLKEIGYKPLLLGVNTTGVNEASIDISSTHAIIEGIDAYAIPKLFYAKNRYRTHNLFIAFKHFMNELYQTQSLHSIICYGSPGFAHFNAKLLKYAHKKRINVIMDVVDWIDVKTGNPLFDLIKKLDTYYGKAIVNKRSDGIIAISSFLKNYYEKAGMKVIILPPLSWKTVEAHEANKIPKIGYAGIPFRLGRKVVDPASLKDRIDLCVYYLAVLKKQGIKFEFHVFGFTKEQYLVGFPEHIKYFKILDDSILFHGVRLMDEVQKAIQSMDYTMLLRNTTRTNTAGFSTKLSESISCGTPVITTRTSDIEKYLIEDEDVNYIQIDDDKIAIEQLRKIITTSSAKRKLNKMLCSKHNTFYYIHFCDVLGAFLSDEKDKIRSI